MGRVAEKVDGVFLFHLPEGVPAVLNPGQVVEGPRCGEEAAFLPVWAGTVKKVREVGETSMRARFQKALGGGGRKTLQAVKSEAEAVPPLVFDDEGFPGGVENGDRPAADAVATGVLEKGCDRVEAHGLIVNKAGEEFCRVMNLEPA